MISVVIPLFNKAHTILTTLESVLKQSYKEFEVVIVDDGSTDNGVSVITNYTNDSRVKIVKQQNQGVSVARNKGVDNSKFDYVAFLDGDDKWLSDYLLKMSKAIALYPNAGLYCSAGFIESNGEKYPRLAKKYEEKITKIDFFHNPHVFLHTSATVVEKEVFYKAKGFPIGMKRNQDFAFFYSLALITEVVYSGFCYSIYVGDVDGQATSKPFNDVMSHIIERYNYVNKNYISLECTNKSFEVFMKYELRHTIVTLIKNNNYDWLKDFMTGLDERIKNTFPIYEWGMLQKKSHKKLSIIYIYLTKIRWRLRGYPRVQ